MGGAGGEPPISDQQRKFIESIRKSKTDYRGQKDSGAEEAETEETESKQAQTKSKSPNPFERTGSKLSEGKPMDRMRNAGREVEGVSVEDLQRRTLTLERNDAREKLSEVIKSGKVHGDRVDRTKLGILVAQANRFDPIPANIKAHMKDGTLYQETKDHFANIARRNQAIQA